MDEKQKRTLTIVFVLVNVIIWGIFIIPKLGSFSEMLFSNISSGSNPAIYEQAETTREMLERIEFQNLRDPFNYPGATTAVTYTVRATTTTTKASVVENVSTPLEVVEEVVQKTFTSQFELDSIMEFDGKYIATLSEASHYGSSTSSVPYSYRFGDNSSSSSGGTTHVVLEGDTVSGEKVAKITADYVIMSQDNLYYKLTLNGGYAVNSLE